MGKKTDRLGFIEIFCDRMENIIKNVEMMGLQNAEFIIEGTPKPIGTGAYVTIPLKYIKRKVKIIILKEEKQGEKKNN